GIGKFDVFLRHRGMTGYDDHIAFLRNLYALRSSGVGHRKSKNYEKAMATFRRPGMGNAAVFASILQQACDLLDYLESGLPAEDRPLEAESLEKGQQWPSGCDEQHAPGH
ncbi:MAG: hypothetical protein KAU28_08975, partial [Phycisphaerae bacterium]|nr:hypothetical protein [Phycisphaerae bacterium]